MGNQFGENTGGRFSEPPVSLDTMQNVIEGLRKLPDQAPLRLPPIDTQAEIARATAVALSADTPVQEHPNQPNAAPQAAVKTLSSEPNPQNSFDYFRAKHKPIGQGHRTKLLGSDSFDPLTAPFEEVIRRLGPQEKEQERIYHTLRSAPPVASRNTNTIKRAPNDYDPLTAPWPVVIARSGTIIGPVIHANLLQEAENDTHRQQIEAEKLISATGAPDSNHTAQSVSASKDMPVFERETPANQAAFVPEKYFLATSPKLTSGVERLSAIKRSLNLAPTLVRDELEKAKTSMPPILLAQSKEVVKYPHAVLRRPRPAQPQTRRPEPTRPKGNLPTSSLVEQTPAASGHTEPAIATAAEQRKPGFKWARQHSSNPTESPTSAQNLAPVQFGRASNASAKNNARFRFEAQSSAPQADTRTKARSKIAASEPQAFQAETAAENDALQEVPQETELLYSQSQIHKKRRGLLGRLALGIQKLAANLNQEVPHISESPLPRTPRQNAESSFGDVLAATSRERNDHTLNLARRSAAFIGTAAIAYLLGARQRKQ